MYAPGHGGGVYRQRCQGSLEGVSVAAPSTATVGRAPTLSQEVLDLVGVEAAHRDVVDGG
jgi:phage-related baseplate assembly protein